MKLEDLKGLNAKGKANLIISLLMGETHVDVNNGVIRICHGTEPQYMSSVEDVTGYDEAEFADDLNMEEDRFSNEAYAEVRDILLEASKHMFESGVK